MPATEQTWYNLKLLHVLFACAAVALMITTVWMLAADHHKEWKGYQRKFRSIEARLTSWREEQEANATQSEHERLGAELLTLRSTPPNRQLYDDFKQEVASDAQRREQPEYDFGDLDARFEELRRQADGTQEGTAAWHRERLESIRTKRGQAADVVSKLRQQQQNARQAGNKASLAKITENLGKALAIARKLSQAEAVAEREKVAAEQAAAEIGQAWLDGLNDLVARARYLEELLLGRRKFKTADYDAARASLDLAIRDAKPQAEIDRIQQSVTRLKEEVDALNLQYQAAARHREALQSIVDDITAREQELRKAMEENRAELRRLESALQDRKATYLTSSFPFLGKKLLELPVVDAFNSPLKIDNLWTENLTIENGSFGRVRRFDRCTTCHRAIAQTMAGTSDVPAYLGQQDIVLTLATPVTAPKSAAGDGQANALTLQKVYGFGLADRGLIDSDEVTVDFVAPDSLAAKAKVVKDGESATPVEDGLRVGDVIVYINNDNVLSPQKVQRVLLQTVTWGEPATLTVRRGLPNPYTSHPRLDLYVGSLSPHKLSIMGCTVCHEGQGSATAFKWASHTPNTPLEAKQWADDHGWFDNHHWILPMFPSRFVESGCLKCHHEVKELEPSAQFPDPPAPKLLRGYNLMQQFGCNGCHEINGYDGPFKRIGPDLRMEPNYSGAAAEVKSDPGFASLQPDQQEWATQLMQHPDRDEVRRQLRELLLTDEQAETPVLTTLSHKMASVLDDVEIPGRLRRAGPSLRFVANKVGAPFLFDWIRRPKHFRDTTRMPQFFGLWNHLDAEGRSVAEKNEPIEILGIVTYLLEKSKAQPWSPLPREPGIDPSTAEEQIARGKQAFELRGCLACHQHADFPGHDATQGPDLSNLGDKLAAPGTPDGRAWLYSWLKDPVAYHARTKMPNLFLEPITDAEGKTTDPAADIAEYLLASRTGWQPGPDVAGYIQQPDPEALHAVALEHLAATFFRREAEQYLANGIPESMRASLKGPEIELVGAFRDEQDAQHKKLMYVGRKTISKGGCFACHDIPGFEDAKPIGTALTDWGRKDPTRLAFEHVVEYLHDREHGDGGSTNHNQAADPHAPAAAMTEEDADADAEFDDSFYRQRLEQHDRVGFIWQKLREPRSYDYKKTENKAYLERLRMPQFSMTDTDREAIVTFVLGLVADPPAEEFLYHPDARKEAIVQGRKVLDQFNCGGCHVLEPERWDLEYEPGDFRPQPPVEDFPFVSPHYSPEQREASLKEDPLRGVLRATIEGMPSINNSDGSPIVLDQEGDPVEAGATYDPDSLQYRFELWEPTLLEGRVYQVGVTPLSVPAPLIRRKRPTLGGDLTKTLLPRVIELERQVNPAANGTEAWGWLPPPLHNEGDKVQPEWLHSFLLDPFRIRPAVVMRMPRFNLSPDEATRLVNYFAAKDNSEFPFEFSERSREPHLALAEQEYRERVAGTDGTSSSVSSPPSGQLRFDHAMRIVTDANYCVKCHLVGDFVPEGSDRAKAPDLSQVYRRLRPEIVRRWIANPTRVLPYTSMPVNIQYDADAPNLGGVSQDLFHGTSVQQLDALVDLLTNYDRYASARSPIAPLVQPASPPAATGAAATGAAAGGAAAGEATTGGGGR